MSDKKQINPEDIRKEFEDFIKNRFGGMVHVVSNVTSPDPAPPAAGPDKRAVDDLNFNYKPKDLKAYLDRFVISQDEAKKAIAIAVCDHYNQVFRTREKGVSESEYAKQNVLVLGPTGVGKTYLVKQIAKLIGVPFVKADATRFSETGYVGANVDDLVRDLVSQAGGDIDLAEYGIIYLDEADKLASAERGMGRDVSGRGVQIGLLKLMEETEVDLTAGNDVRSQMQAFMEMQQKGRVQRKIVNTKHILFIVSGAFSGLEAIIKKRLNQSNIGFAAGKASAADENEPLAYAATEDLVEYGFEPEFVGRLPIRVACRHLSEDDLYQILKNSEGSIIKQYVDGFAAFGIRAKFHDDALRAIAKKAHAQKTGARALMTVTEEALREFKYELPSSRVRLFEIKEDVINRPKEALAILLSEKVSESRSKIEDAIGAAEENFFSAYQMRISFMPHARDLIAERVGESGDVSALLQQILQSYEHGLKLIQQNTGQSEFELAEDVVKDPKGTLERLIRESYSVSSRHKEP